MKELLFVMKLFLTLLTLAVTTASSPAQQNQNSHAAKLLALAKPGPEHDAMAKFAGKWEVTITRGKSTPKKGGGTSHMILENRFLWIGYGGGRGEQKFKGQFTLGFDRRNEEYNLTAMDLDGTYWVSSTGKENKDTGTIKLQGKDNDPHMKAMGFDKEFAHQITFKNNDTFTIEVFYIDTRTKDRTERKALEYHFARK